MEIIKVKIDDLVFDPNNVRKHPTKNLDAIKGSLTKFGQQKPIVIDSKNIVIAGNGTLAAAKQLGWKEIAAVRTQLDDLNKMAFALADNRTSELAEWDIPELNQQLAQLDMGDFDIKEIGFDIGDFDIDKEEEKEGLSDPDQVPDVPQNIFGVKRGDVWQLGNHRLMCGDSTSESDVAKLMDGKKADMVWTDPPYNVALGMDETAEQAKARGRRTDGLVVKNDKMSDSDFREFLYKVFKNYLENTKKGGAIYVAHADSEGYNFRGAMRDSGWLVKQCLIWVKSALVMGRQDYQWKHEPILYGWKEGSSHNWFSDRKQSTVMEFDKPSRNEFHPTMKPVELVEYNVKNSSKNGELVTDYFSGSGSTLIACEKTGRICYGMELDEHYCSVIIKRWQDFTGHQATKIN
jgi:site-specific DNA-methyltransferase (adenine-specific)